MGEESTGRRAVAATSLITQEVIGGTGEDSTWWNAVAATSLISKEMIDYMGEDTTVWRAVAATQWYVLFGLGQEMTKWTRMIYELSKSLCPLV